MQKKYWYIIVAAIITALGTVVAASLPALLGGNPEASVANTGSPDKAKGNTGAQLDFPVALSSFYKPTGWMGDGEKGIKFLSVERVATEIEGRTLPATKIVYRPGGPEGWAGIYWQYPENNWGAKPGRSLEGARSISFYARGETGKEVAEFKAGGISDPDLEYHDSFETSLGDIVLSKEWERHEISLTGKDLSNVIGAFAWISTAPTSEPLTAYLAGIQIN